MAKFACIIGQYMQKYHFTNFHQMSDLVGGSIPQLLILNSEMNLKFFFQSWGSPFYTTFDPELRNERFTLISFMGFPAILSTLQPFQICIFNRKHSKLTFSNGPQLMGKRFMANLHASFDSTQKSSIS